MPLTSKEKSQRWRDKKKMDISAHAEYLKSERKRYRERIITGSRKKIDDLSDRAKRQKRKVWRLQQKESRNRKALQRRGIETPATPVVPAQLADTPTSHNSNGSTPGTSATLGHFQLRLRGRKKIRKDRSKAYRTIEKLNKKVSEQTKLIEKYKKALNRQKYKFEHNKNTPRSKMQRDLAGSRVSQKVRRTLLFHNALMSEMKEQFSAAKTVKDRRSLCQVLTGKILKKYRVLRMVHEFGCDPRVMVRKCKAVERKMSGRSCKWNAVNNELRDKVQSFFLREDNSRCTSGKKDTITRCKKKMQIHLLADSVKNLHAKYTSENVNSNLSYTSFSRLRPFWVIQQSVSKRDTCLCRTCDNLQLIANKLHSECIITTTDVKQLLKICSCDAQNTECMLGACRHCSTSMDVPSAQVHLLNVDTEVDLDKKMTWNEWKTIEETRYKKTNSKQSKEFIVKVTKKVQVEGSTGDILDRLEYMLRYKAKRHFYTIDHQYKVLRNLKSSLGSNEICLHIDYAENYCCKQCTEVQSMHFGASRNQVTMHNVVVYTPSGTVCLSTLSDSMRHDPCAVWSYLQPVLTHLLNLFPDVDIVHFVSDSPATQYRCKNNFFLFCTLPYCYWPQIVHCTWNYLEAGHGKGAPDGVGGLLKRTADRLVSCGQDLSDAMDVYTALRSSQTSVHLFFVPDSDIQTVDNFLDNASLSTVRGTMKIRQIVTQKYGTISFRPLSCFCNTDKYVMCMCHAPSTVVFATDKNVSEGGDNSHASTVYHTTTGTSVVALWSNFALLFQFLHVKKY